jgi:hypothetical protein
MIVTSGIVGTGASPAPYISGFSSAQFTGNVTAANVSATNNFALPVFANSSVRDSTITSPQPGMMIFVTGTGMQVRGATQWNTVTGTGT